MRNFYAGQKVICIAEGDWVGTEKRKLEHPVRGAKYTVRDVYESEDGEIALRLFEIVNKPQKFPNGKQEEIGFSSSEFRPLSNKQTDISALIPITLSTRLH